jgi:hypothetical protein
MSAAKSLGLDKSAFLFAPPLGRAAPRKINTDQSKQYRIKIPPKLLTTYQHCRKIAIELLKPHAIPAITVWYSTNPHTNTNETHTITANTGRACGSEHTGSIIFPYLRSFIKNDKKNKANLC